MTWYSIDTFLRNPALFQQERWTIINPAWCLPSTEDHPLTAHMLYVNLTTTDSTCTCIILISNSIIYFWIPSYFLKIRSWILFTLRNEMLKVRAWKLVMNFFFQPQGFSSQMVEMAFRKWITMVTTVRLPLLVFNGILVQFPLFKGTAMKRNP